MKAYDYFLAALPSAGLAFLFYCTQQISFLSDVTLNASLFSGLGLIIFFMILGWLKSLDYGRVDFVDLLWGRLLPLSCILPLLNQFQGAELIVVACILGAMLFVSPYHLRILSKNIYRRSLHIYLCLSTVLLASYALMHPSHSLVFLVFIVITCWSVRLESAIRLKMEDKEDKRYDGFRDTFGRDRYWWFSLFQVFLLQGVLLWIVSFPIHVLLVEGAWNYFVAAGLGVASIGIIYEYVADKQLYNHRKHHPGTICQTGLWAYSRHPNYFGEMLAWLGFTAAAVTATSSYLAIALSILSFVTIAFLLVKVSGVAMTQNIMSQRPGYDDYLKRTPALFPNFWKSSRTRS